MMLICNIFCLLFFFSSLSFAKTIAFLDFEDKTMTGKGNEEMDLVISNLFPSERFNLIPREKVNRVLTPTIQKELGVITPEIAWTIGELLDCDVIVVGSIEGSPLQRLIRFSFIEGGRKKDPYLADHVLDLFSAHFGLNCKIENKSHPYSFLDLSLYLGTLNKAEKRPAGLAVSSIPNNCEVFLDGRLMGLTPLFIPNLEEKVYEVVVKKEGFSEQTQKVLVKGEQEIKVNLYSTSLPKEVIIPPKEKEYLLELIFLPTAHCLKKGELEFGLTYPDLFLLKAGLPSNLKTEVRVFGIGAGLKYNIIDWVGIDLYYKAYDMEKNERQKHKGFWLLGSFPSKFFNIHLGLGYLWKEASNNSQYFLGMDRATKGFNLLAEYEKDKLAFGIRKPLKFFEIKLGLGYADDEVSYNLGIYLKRVGSLGVKSQESKE